MNDDRKTSFQTRWPAAVDDRMRAMFKLGEVDVVILGAGINGAGLFRDLCAQGISCLLVDKSDFGSGTSAAPSRLIHGGLKYLETGELRLVAQSTLERNLLLRNAPHYVKPLPTVIPIFSYAKGCLAALRTLFGSSSAPRSRGALLIKMGLMIYDFYGARHRVLPRHRIVGKTKSLQEMPSLTPMIVATGTYYDATVTHPERLVLELIKDGLSDNSKSAALNHVVLKKLHGDRLEFLSDLTGATIAVCPKIVVNAAGPWIDQVNRTLGEKTQMIGGTKGSHIFLRHDALVRALNGKMIYFEADDGRICLVYDYLGCAMIGSTDFKAYDPDNVKCDESEIDYLLESMRMLFPKLTFDRTQIVYSYSGIRPLPSSDAKDPGLISRDHATIVLEPRGSRSFPVVSLVGGKWTTFRGFAEEVSDIVLARLGRERNVTTKKLPIGGGRDFPEGKTARQSWLAMVESETGLSSTLVDKLLDRYGTVARDVAGHISTFIRDIPLPGTSDYTSGEIDYLVREELVGHLSDIVMRRTTLAVTGQLTMPLLNAIAELAAVPLGWDDARIAREVSNVQDQMLRLHGVDVTSSASPVKNAIDGHK